MLSVKFSNDVNFNVEIRFTHLFDSDFLLFRQVFFHIYRHFYLFDHMFVGVRY